MERKEPRADGDTRLTFQYDYLGRRVGKQVFAWSTDHWQLTTDQGFIYDGWNVVEVFNMSTTPATLLTQYTWGPDLSGSLQGAGGIGGLLAWEWPQTTGESKKYWFFYDANGNVGQLLRYRTAGGDSITPAARYEYDPYGNTIAALDMDAQSDLGAADANPFRFSTKWLDNEAATPPAAGAVGTTGLYYYGYRYYSPGLGRWINRDPIGEDGGVAVYVFAANGPLGKIDSLGLAVWDGTLVPALPILCCHSKCPGGLRLSAVLTISATQATPFNPPSFYIAYGPYSRPFSGLITGRTRCWCEYKPSRTCTYACASSCAPATWIAACNLTVSSGKQTIQWFVPRGTPCGPCPPGSPFWPAPNPGLCP